jgi:SAM-dependent methyltransferase
VSNDYYHNESIAAAYDTENSGETVTTDDIPFYASLAKAAAAAGHSVLELGCGTGRVTIPMAQAGVNIVGLDSSAEMLAVAQAKAAGLQNIRWLRGDMAAFNLEQRFGLVIIPFRSFLLLLTLAEQKSCLARIHQHLVDGGRLALNFFNPDLAMIASWNTAKRGLWQRERLNSGRELWSTRRYLTADQRLEETDAYVTLSDQGAVIARVERNLRLRYVFRYEMEHLLALSGFEVEALYGWFDGRPFDDDSSEMVWLARKR